MIGTYQVFIKYLLNEYIKPRIKWGRLHNFFMITLFLNNLFIFCWHSLIFNNYRGKKNIKKKKKKHTHKKKKLSNTMLILVKNAFLTVVLIAKSCPTLCNPMDCSPPGSSVQGISQAIILEWVAISFSRGSS